MKLAPGQTFGRYLIERFIGQGGMGVVFRAQDTLLERPVALKVILPEHAKDPEAVPRFFREAKLAAKLTHPNAVHLYDLGEVEGMPFMAMELIDGRSLVTFISDGAFTPDRKLKWMLGVARGLAAAHERGLIHRDVKPANVMVSPTDDLAKIVDFGLAKRIKTTPVLRSTFRTQTGFVMGTPAYMAPEALGGEDPDERSDQFGWALTTHTVIAGVNPRANDPMLERPIAMLSDIHPAIPRRAALVVIRALSNDPAMRYASMTDLADALAEALLIGTLAPPPVTTPFSRPPSMSPSINVLIGAAPVGHIQPGSIPPAIPKRTRPSAPPAPVSRNTPAPMAARTPKMVGAPAADPMPPAHNNELRVPANHPFARAYGGFQPAPVRAPVRQMPAAMPLAMSEKERRKTIEESARACAKRMRYVDERKFAVAKAGFTAYKREMAFQGTPLVAEINKERWTFTRSRPASPAVTLRLATFGADGQIAFALSTRTDDDTAYVLNGERWETCALSGVRPGEIQCAKMLGDGRVAIGGMTGVAAIATVRGSVELWSGTLGDSIFSAVDAREIDGALELVFVGQASGAGVAAVGMRGRLKQHTSVPFGPITSVSCGKVIMIAGRDLGIVTEEGIEGAGNSDGARSFVSLDDNSALALSQSGFVYFNPLNTATWAELGVEYKRPLVAAAASRTEVYAVDERGSVSRRAASWTWSQLHGGAERARDAIAMWAGPGRIRILCADGAIVAGFRE